MTSYVLLYSSGDWDGVSDYFCGVYSSYAAALAAIPSKLRPGNKPDDFTVREVQVDAEFQ